MMNNEQVIPCPTPNCGGKIHFDTYQLLQGAQFVCPNCNGAVGIAPESRPMVQETMQKFDEMKKDLLKQKEDNSMS